MASMLKVPLVVFTDVLDQYSVNTDLTCRFKVSPNYESQETDSLAIFKLGWSHVTESVAMRCVPEVPADGKCSVTFNQDVLPKDTLDLYQICYISGLDLHGASTPFQFCSEADYSLLECSNSFNKSFMLVDRLKNCDCSVERDNEISKLKEENAILKESLRIVLTNPTDNNSADYNRDLQEIKDLMEGLKSMLSSHDKDIQMLKSKILEGGEEYRKLYLEKIRVQKKYDKLKSKFMENKCPVQELKEPINDFNLDLGELQSIPPFPSISK